MPFELMLMFGFSGVGLLAGIFMLVVNSIVIRKSKAPALPSPNAVEPATALSAKEDSAAIEEMVMQNMQSNLAPVDEPAKTMPLEEKAAGQDPITVVGSKAEPVQSEKPAMQKLAPVFTPLDRSEGGAVIGNIRLTVGNSQAQGTRDEQEDAFAITPVEEAGILMNHGVMAVVCDGMGGMSNGAKAASGAALEFMRTYLENPPPIDETMLKGVYAANERVLGLNKAEGGRAGTTLSAAAVTRHGLWFVSVGDSHIYLHRNEKLYQLNTDHNYYAELLERVRRGEMRLEDARKHPERAHLTSFIGKEQLTLVDANAEPIALRPGDRVLLCSDGLFKTLPATDMQRILNDHRRDAHEEMLLAVEKAGKKRQDNVTVVIMYLDAV